jgi:hypothetical protein
MVSPNNVAKTAIFYTPRDDKYISPHGVQTRFFRSTPRPHKNTPRLSESTLALECFCVRSERSEKTRLTYFVTSWSLYGVYMASVPDPGSPRTHSAIILNYG